MIPLILLLLLLCGSIHAQDQYTDYTNSQRIKLFADDFSNNSKNWKESAEDRVTYAEPIVVGKRLRDGVQMDNGWMAIITDDDGLFLVRDPAVNDSASPTITLAGYDKVNEVEAVALEFDREFSWGRMRYSSNCASCHLLNGEVRVGPPLNGLIGRKVASFPDYPYSDGLKSIKGRWTVSKLARFLENPRAMAPDTTMAAHYEFEQWEFRVIADYIASVDEDGLK